jgi:hypothetical protein
LGLRIVLIRGNTRLLFAHTAWMGKRCQRRPSSPIESPSPLRRASSRGTQFRFADNIPRPGCEWYQHGVHAAFDPESARIAAASFWWLLMHQGVNYILWVAAITYLYSKASVTVTWLFTTIKTPKSADKMVRGKELFNR